MPLYDYECRSCGHVVEVLHGVNDRGPTACEECGGPMRKLISTPSIVFKGSGWAKKDARDSRTSAKSSGSKSTEPKSAGESTSKAGESSTSSESATSSAESSATKESPTTASSD